MTSKRSRRKVKQQSRTFVPQAKIDKMREILVPPPHLQMYNKIDAVNCRQR